MGIDTARINGAAHSWGDVEFRGQGELLNQFTAIGWDEKLERVMLYGAAKHRRPIGVSKGKYVPGKLKITNYVGGADAFKVWLAAKSPDGRSLANAVFNAMLQFTGANDLPISVFFCNVRFASATDSHKEGSEGLTCDIELDFEFIVRTINGTAITVWDSSEEVI